MRRCETRKSTTRSGVKVKLDEGVGVGVGSRVGSYEMGYADNEVEGEEEGEGEEVEEGSSSRGLEEKSSVNQLRRRRNEESMEQTHLREDNEEEPMTW